jgi:transmembrane sensor
MEKNYNLAKWLNNEMSKAELADFEASPDFEKYEKIKNYSAQLKVADFDADSILENVIKHKKATPKVISIYRNWMFKVAAVLVVGLAITFTMQNFATKTQYALNGKKTSFSLPDDSEVVLNSGSEIKFKKWNWNNNRSLKLDGEAYFKVAKGKKFEVETNLGKVAVLGTEFNVKSRKNRFDITCFEGRVKVNYKDKEIILTHGQSVSFENGLQIISLATNKNPEWLKNQIAFNKEHLRNILDEIERQYNVSIDVKTEYPEELFTGKIPTNNLDIAIKIIASTYHLETKLESNKIIFEGK